MNFTETLRCLKYLPPLQSVFLRGIHGKGKSRCVFQAAAELSVELKLPFEVVDLRLSHYELGDMIGIPHSRDSFNVTRSVYVNGIMEQQVKVATNVMVHDLPLWFPTDPESRGFLFMDEIDRAGLELHNWSMQIVNDYESNFVKLPIGWNVIAAGNNDDTVYDVRQQDAAGIDRYQVIDFKPTVREWINHAKATKVIDPITKYIEKFGEKALDPPATMDRGSKYPSRRSWVKLSDRIKYLKSRGDDLIANIKTDGTYFEFLVSGFIGSEAVGFREWVETQYKVYTAEEILNNFPKLKDYFNTLVSTDFAFYNQQVIDYIKELNGNKLKLSAEQSDNLLMYAQTMPKECAANLWTLFKKQCYDEATRWFKNPMYSKFITSVMVISKRKD